MGSAGDFDLPGGLSHAYDNFLNQQVNGHLMSDIDLGERSLLLQT